MFQAFPTCDFSRQIEALARRLLRDDWVRDREHAKPALPPALPPLDPAQPGLYLRRCREALGASLREMTDRTCIRVLDDMEAERVARLPPEPYLRGYLLSYGQELGVPDLARLVACYLRRVGGVEADAA